MRSLRRSGRKGKNKLSHAELVQLAERWLLKTCACGFAFTELKTYCPEIPDAIGFRSGISILIECKATRVDFLHDGKKRFRKYPEQGMGAFRFYLCEKGLIQPHELPKGWGLIWTDGNKCRKKVGPKGNAWDDDRFYFCEHNIQGEMILMQSALRRLHLRGVLDLIYEAPVIKRKRKRKK